MTAEKKILPSDPDLLVEIGESEAALSHWQSRAYVTIQTEKGPRTLPLKGPAAQTWLRRRFRDRHGRIPSTAAVRTALAVLADIASLSEETRVWLRTAKHDGSIYIDLADDSGVAIKIDQTDWNLVATPPVKFIRSKLTLPLPRPSRQGDTDAFRKLVNLRDEGSFQLLMTWCVAALMPVGPYPVLAIAGEQGAGKSLLARLVGDLIDPSRLRLRSLPYNERDLYIACSNTHVLAFDNLSRISDWLSDLFCKVVTGGGIGLRENYSDDGEVYFEAQRPIVLTAIEDVVRRPDLADRAIVLTLPPIPEHERLDPAEFEARFEACRSETLGALLDLMWLACWNLPTLKTDRLPRLAGFAKLGIAIENAFGGKGSFMAAYDSNRAAASASIAETDPLCAAIEAFHAAQAPWRGSATLLASLLEGFIIPPKPINPAVLGGRLRRLAPILRARGISIDFDRVAKGRDRLITLSDLLITA